MHHGLSKPDWGRSEWERDRQMERTWAREDAYPVWRLVRGDGCVEFIRATHVTEIVDPDTGDKTLHIWHEQKLVRQIAPYGWRSAALWEEEDEPAD